MEATAKEKHMRRDKIRWSLLGVLAGAFVLMLGQMSALAQSSSSSFPVCPRFASGSVISQAPDLFSENGVLKVNLKYQTTVDANGLTLFCYMMSNGQQSPTLHVRPGDTIIFTITNTVPPPPPGQLVFSMSEAEKEKYMKMSAPRAQEMMKMMNMAQSASTQCGDAMQDATSTNVHYHGTNTSPTCHSDEVIHTLINSGTTFQYQLHIPSNEPPGLYWYHPHVHGLAEAALQGGASGALIVQGIGNVNPETEGLGERIMMVRDNPLPGGQTPSDTVPSWDLSLNYAPVPFPNYPPVVIPMRPGEKQLWRVANSTSDSILDLAVQFDGVNQPIRIVGLDGVPTGSQDGTQTGKTIVKNHILVPTAGRVEFIVTAPFSSRVNAQLVTLAISTGPAGDSDPFRPLGKIQVSRSAQEPPITIQDAKAKKHAMRWEAASTCVPTVQRTLYFSEVISNPADPSSPTNFFITVDGATPTLFDPTNPPAIVTTQGSCEEWTIQNRATENHEFHMHQIHFLLQQQNGVNVSPDDAQFLDMVQVPFWDGVSTTFPSVKVKMSFEGADIGDFVYHCHILGHEDNGMMAIIRVLPPGASTASKTAKPATVGAPAKGSDTMKMDGTMKMDHSSGQTAPGFTVETNLSGTTTPAKPVTTAPANSSKPKGSEDKK
jgi:FtsP/CotA-like multicopper oxidase with cupredoxin domain